MLERMIGLRRTASLVEVDGKSHARVYDRAQAQGKPERGRYEASYLTVGWCSSRSLSKVVKSSEQTKVQSECAVARKRQVLYFSLELMLYKEPSFGKNKILLAHMELWSYQRKILVKLFVVSSMDGFN